MIQGNIVHMAQDLRNPCHQHESIPGSKCNINCIILKCDVTVNRYLFFHVLCIIFFNNAIMDWSPLQCIYEAKFTHQINTHTKLSTPFRGDPEFSVRGAPILRRRQHAILPNVPKQCMILRKFFEAWKGRGAEGPPPSSAIALCTDNPSLQTFLLGSVTTCDLIHIYFLSN